MAQSRLITSDIWADDWFGPLPFFDQALWIGLFSQCADDQGRLLDNPVLIRAAVFPYKDTPIADIAAALTRFAEAGKLTRYEADGKRLLQIVNWWEHQRPQWAQASKWPAPEGWADAVRTRQNGQYLADNWTGARGFQVNGSGEPTTLCAQAGGQDPNPDPVEVQVPNPTPTPVGVVEPPQPARASRADADADPDTTSTPTTGLLGLVHRTFDANALNAETPNVVAEYLGRYGEERVRDAIEMMDHQAPLKRGWPYVKAILTRWEEEDRASAPPGTAAPPGNGNGHVPVLKPWKAVPGNRLQPEATP